MSSAASGHVGTSHLAYRHVQRLCSCAALRVHVVKLTAEHVGGVRGGGDAGGGDGGAKGGGDGRLQAQSRSYAELVAAQDIDEAAPMVQIPTQLPPQQLGLLHTPGPEAYPHEMIEVQVPPAAAWAAANAALSPTTLRIV